jgi:hypothetical protein
VIPINWPEGPPGSTVYCRCGGVWRTHTKTDYVVGITMAKDPCPWCGKHDDVRRVSSDPERFVVDRTGEMP